MRAYCGPVAGRWPATTKFGPQSPRADNKTRPATAGCPRASPQVSGPARPACNSVLHTPLYYNLTFQYSGTTVYSLLYNRVNTKTFLSFSEPSYHLRHLLIRIPDMANIFRRSTSVCTNEGILYTKRTKVFVHIPTVPHGRNMRAT